MPKLTYAAPQLLVDDLEAAIRFYRDTLLFNVDFVYEGFYAGISRDGALLHLKCASKSPDERKYRHEHEHLDAYIEVKGVRELHDIFVSRGAKVVNPIGERAWGQIDFYVEDPSGNILCFSEPAG